VLLDPLGFNVTLGSEENSVLEFLLQFDDQLSSDGEEDSV